jgi:MFS family permease
MDELRIINFLDAFITSSLSIIIPLLLVARGVDVVQIGLVISMSPVIFVVSRSIFAAMSDQVGVRRFFILNGVMNVISFLFYMVASSPFLFSIGKIVEGVRNGTIWAVNRTAVFIRRGKGGAAEMTKTQVIRTAAAAMGIVAAGMLLNSYTFDLVFIFFIILSFVLLAVSFLVEGSGRSNVKMKEIFGQLDFRRKSDILKKGSLVAIPQSVATAIPLSLVFPLFLNSIGYNYGLIGIAIALYYAVSAVTAFIYMKMKWGARAIWIGGFCFLIGGILLPMLDGAWAVPLIAIMGIGDGMSTPLWEAVVFTSVRKSRDVSSDIALLHTPSNLSNAVGLIAAGVVVKLWGYGVVFFSCGILFALSFYWCFRLLNESKYFL